VELEAAAVKTLDVRRRRRHSAVSRHITLHHHHRHAQLNKQHGTAESEMLIRSCATDQLSGNRMRKLKFFSVIVLIRRTLLQSNI